MITFAKHLAGFQRVFMSNILTTYSRMKVHCSLYIFSAQKEQNLIVLDSRSPHIRYDRLINYFKKIMNVGSVLSPGTCPIFCSKKL